MGARGAHRGPRHAEGLDRGLHPADASRRAGRRRERADFAPSRGGARFARVELANEKQAIELYRELLDGSDGGVGDEVASKALRELYAEQKAGATSTI